MGADHDGAQASDVSDVEKGEEQLQSLKEPLIEVPSRVPPLGYGYNGKDVVLGWIDYSPGTKFVLSIAMLAVELIGVFDQVQNPAYKQSLETLQGRERAWSFLTMSWDAQPASMDAYVKWVGTLYVLAMCGLLATIPLLAILGFCYLSVPLCHKEKLVVYGDIPLRLVFMIFSITVFDTLCLNCGVRDSCRNAIHPNISVGLLIALNVLSLWELYRKYGTKAWRWAEPEFLVKNVALLLALHSIMSFLVWGFDPGFIVAYLFVHAYYRRVRTARLNSESES